MSITKDELVNLRESGLSYQAIGSAVGISRQRAHQIISGYGRILNQLKGRTRIRYIYEVILDRDNYRCTRCGAVKNLLIHHRDNDDMNNRVGNLICLCQTCHLALHRPNKKMKQVIAYPEYASNELRKPCFLFPKKAAAYLGLTIRQLYGAVRSGQITPVVLRHRRGSQEYFVEYFDRQTLTPLREEQNNQTAGGKPAD